MVTADAVTARTGWPYSSLGFRAFQCWMTVYRRIWRSSVWSSVLGPLFYLGAMCFGLGSLVDRVISVGEVFRWKPSQMVYLYAAEVLDVPPQWLALVAAHDWDCHGAKRAGLITGWVSRKSGGFGAPFEPPDVVGEDLTEVAAKLLALSS